MLLILLIFLPVLSGLLSFALKGNTAKYVGFISTLCTLSISAYLASSCCNVPAVSHYAKWLPDLGAGFNLYADGMSQMLCLLTGIVTATVFIAQLNKQVENEGFFYGLILLTQAGLNGVFLAHDALLFYVFWELALIPVYFLCSLWGGEKRIPVTFKFFVYTFTGSLLMLSALIYLSFQPNTTQFDAYSWEHLVAAGKQLPAGTQNVLFVLIFLAFAVKMPIFPFHTWQPDAYEQSPTAVTILLSALMVKMGLYAVLRWLLPVVPAGVQYWSQAVIWLSVIGILYASCIAMVQTDIKRLVAYSSIAHIGLMCAVAFVPNVVSIQGIMVQMFNHGINITGMWLIISFLENRYATRNMSKLGGLASTAPAMAIALLIISFANIALPLTNGFIGEFMMFTGLFTGYAQHHIFVMLIAGSGVILGAVYTLGMIQKTAYGDAVPTENTVTDLSLNELIGISIIIVLILVLGIYPKPLIELTEAATKSIALMP